VIAKHPVNNGCWLYTREMFQHREDAKRSHTLALRLSDEERDAVQWCQDFLKSEDGTRRLPVDVLRQAMAEFYDRLRERSELSQRKSLRSKKR